MRPQLAAHAPGVQTTAKARFGIQSEAAPGPVLALEPLLTAAEVGSLLGVRAKRVYELGIPAVKISERSLRWRPSQVAEWIQQREGG